MKRDYKKFVDNEIEENKEIEYISLKVRYKDGIEISYKVFSEN
jgi:hypothetical protein